MSTVLTRAIAPKTSTNAKAKVVGHSRCGRQTHIRGNLGRFVRADALNTDDGTLCHFRADYHKLYRVGYADTLPDYLKILDTRMTKFDLPLGANLETRPCGQVVLQVPPAR